ncbi:hypothetical protein DY000_02045767 [Brassica cretica]|uniref:Uncharacterized protein n=1 Tax=Brassica cretica TaxID=69181 RepID=A0ABQ7F2U1_BRACR|nr:hypothetical protein DY000_02045767 [Brassica cretica]
MRIPGPSSSGYFARALVVTRLQLTRLHDHKVESSCGYSDVEKKIHLASPRNSLLVTSSSRGMTYARSNSVSRKRQVRFLLISAKEKEDSYLA